MGFFSKLARKKHIPTEQERREFLQKHGRITDGAIIDTETDRYGGEIVFYLYSVNGVDFESSERLTEEQMNDPLRYAPGAKVGIRFDPKNHGNSILV